MDPSQIVIALRHIASGIQNSKNPSKSIVANDLNMIISALSKKYTGILTFTNTNTNEVVDKKMCKNWKDAYGHARDLAVQFETIIDVSNSQNKFLLVADFEGESELLRGPESRYYDPSKPSKSPKSKFQTSSQIIISLRRIASKIQASKNPSISAVLYDLKKTAQEFEEQVIEDVHNLMERGLPRVYDGDSSVIKSNFSVENADIFLTYQISSEDGQSLHDTYRTQFTLSKNTVSNARALLVWPEADVLIDFDSYGSVKGSESHELDELGKIMPKLNARLGKSEIGVNSINQIKNHAILLTNEEFLNKQKEHGYSSWLF